jgi:hypothetical protein
MRIFFLYLATLAFLFMELVGLVYGVNLQTLLFRSVGVFILFLIFGNIVASIVDGILREKSESDTQADGIDATAGANSAPPEAIANAESGVLKDIKQRPQESARAMEALINK